MRARFLSFTDRGQALAESLAAALGGEVCRCGGGAALKEWTDSAFREAEALVFVGAAGSAVRAVAPFLRSKASDPAVVAVDETGRYAVPLLGGHLGGANALAAEIGRICGAEPVITTATDRRGVFAVDLWAKAQGCAVAEPERIKAVSARLLAGETAFCQSDWPVSGEPPAGVRLGEGPGFRVTVLAGEEPRLHLVPRIAVLGVGCRRGIGPEALERAYLRLLASCRLRPQAVREVCSIHRKKDEEGLLAFCAAHGWALRTFSPEELAAAPGTFTASDRVLRAVGVDNVCERAAVLGSGGDLICRKQAGEGVTMAAALAPFAPDWRW